ncbi:heat shock protein 70 family [Schizophyllum amplum]|uniref:Heat shock protein 70 family n=1 Tax=Schizophyllum amplum TaxID=97359 RepID=A0A550CZL8_9AGAR|nr:heat shock protein 70 family [Auriculariopsis ampla]
MSVVGIDFGTLHSKIGVARHRGIDIIANEVSNRATPSLVAFGPKQRAIGEAAKTQETSNFKNTIGSLKRLIGRTFADPEVQEVEKKFLNAKLVDVQGTVGVQVNYLGEPHTFTATQLVAMYIAKLRDITAAELKNAVSDMVIAVPGWYTDIQRRAMLDAAQIANVNVLRLVNDTTAVALGYGITKSDLPEDGERNIIFVDVGHSSISTSAVAFSKGRLVVKASAYDRHCGGRDIDYALVQHFGEQFKEKYKIDVFNNPKATFRLVASCEKLKKILSANAEAPLNVESIMNDIDASSKLTRDELEQLIAPVLDRITAPLQRVLEESGLTLDQVDGIELIGGSTRIPSVRAKIQSVFPGKVLSTTLNQDEAAARGATFSCAMLSPVFKVRDFHMTDINAYPIKLEWDPIPDSEDDTPLTLFPHNNAMPIVKALSLRRKEPFEVQAAYEDPAGLPGGINPFISRFVAKEVPADPSGDFTTVKLRARLNLHGIMSFDSYYIEEVEEREEPAAMDVDGGEAAPPKKKRYTKKKELPFIATHTSLDKSIVEQYREQETQMWAADKLVMDTEDRKNALEEYVYDMRGKLDERYASYVQPDEKTKLLAALQEAEDWLYTEEGEEATKSLYVQRLDALKKLGDPITLRWRENEERPRAMAKLRETLNNYMTQATSGEERFAHIADADKQSVVEKVATVQKWLEDQTVRQSERPKNVDPVLTTVDMDKKRDEVIYFATPILTKPKPKPPVVPNTGSGTQTPKPETPQPDADKKEEKKEEGPSEMDVD